MEFQSGIKIFIVYM